MLMSFALTSPLAHAIYADLFSSIEIKREKVNRVSQESQSTSGYHIISSTVEILACHKQSHRSSLPSSEDSSSCVVIRWFFVCSGLLERLESLEPRFKGPIGALTKIGVFD